jgi:hypothetical protein
MDIIKKRPINPDQVGKMITTLKKGETIRLSGPGDVQLMSTAHDGHKDQVRIAVIAPHSTRFRKI